jgi:hypothetical protein
LRYVEMLHTNPASLSVEKDIFGGVSLDSAILAVPAGSKPAYQNTAPWKDFGTIVEM